MLIGVDTGGTFTDFIVVTRDGIRTHKQLSSPDAPERAIFEGLRALGIATDGVHIRLVHGTTVATNAALEGKGCRTAVVTNRGFGDVLLIGRQARAELYNLQPSADRQVLPNTQFFEVNTRRDHNGALLQDLSDADIDALVASIDAAEVDAVAINLLYSYRNNHEEQRLRDKLGSRYYTSISSEVWPVEKEYERGITTWLNSWLGPKIKDYINVLQTQLQRGQLDIMHSSGGVLSAQEAVGQACQLLLSGPAGGLAAAQFIAQQLGIAH